MLCLACIFMVIEICKINNTYSFLTLKKICVDICKNSKVYVGSSCPDLVLPYTLFPLIPYSQHGGRRYMFTPEFNLTISCYVSVHVLAD